MSKEEIKTPVSADVLIHNHGKKPSEETRAKIMDFIASHKDETMALTEDSLPEPAPEKQTPHLSPRERARRAQAKQSKSGDKGDSSEGGTARRS